LSRTSEDHELVSRYLSELDAALRGVPAAQARELKEQIVAHLADSLPPDADDEQVRAVLGRLGAPADLAADAGPAGVAPLAALGLTGAWLRRRFARVRLRTWIAVGVIGIFAGTMTGYLIYFTAPGPLEFGGASGWWYPQDYNHEVDTSAGNSTQTTVPNRSGQLQGFFITISNPTDVTQTILGPGYGQAVPPDSLGQGAGRIGVSVPNLNIERGGDSRSVRFTLPGVIPPHQFRELRVLWKSDTCMMAGGGESIDEISLRVRVGWFTRTEIIPLYESWAVAGPSHGPCGCLWRRLLLNRPDVKRRWSAKR
jgi:hypothetical protein